MDLAGIFAWLTFSGVLFHLTATPANFFGHIKVSPQSVAKFDGEFQTLLLRLDSRFPGLSGHADFWAAGYTLSSSTWRWTPLPS